MKASVLMLMLATLICQANALGRGYIPDNLSDIADAVRESIVSIEVERPLAANDPKTPLYRLRPATACSGVIVDRNGLVLTTYYNIQDATRIHVRLDNGQLYLADVVGWDEGRDIAMLKINQAPLPVLRLATRASLQVGEAVAVIGRGPSGNLSVAPGIVSATNRFDNTAFQMDCAVNLCSSGGAVVNAEGRLIGIAAHVSHNASWGYNSGVAFAIPLIDETMKVLLDELKQGKRITKPSRPKLGVQMAQEDPGRPGALIGEVEPGSAADKAGLEKDDIIVAFNNKPIRSWDELVDSIQKTREGDPFTITVIRGGEKESFNGVMGRF